MRTTIDRAGRVVIPKRIRDEAGLDAGTEVDVQFRDGRIEIAPAGFPMRVVKRGGKTVLDTEMQMPPISAEEVRGILERTRR